MAPCYFTFPKFDQRADKNTSREIWYLRDSNCIRLYFLTQNASFTSLHLTQYALQLCAHKTEMQVMINWILFPSVRTSLSVVWKSVLISSFILFSVLKWYGAVFFSLKLSSRICYQNVFFVLKSMNSQTISNYEFNI